MKVMFVVLLLWGYGALATVQAAQPAQLEFCHEDENAYPWVFPSGKGADGLDIRLIRRLERELGISIKLHSLPWKRCLSHLQNGIVDGAFASSYKAERLTMGVYPTKANGELDGRLRIHISSYSLYTLLDSKLQWDGQTLAPLPGSISTQLGFSIADKLKKIGASVSEVKGPERALKDVLTGLSLGAALQTDRADYILGSDPLFTGKIKKHPIPLAEKNYYLMLSFDLVSNYPAYAQQIWQTLATQRDSQEMITISREFWQ